MHKKLHPRGLKQWLEFYWLIATNPVFRASPDKRKAYYEYRLGKYYSAPCG